MNWLKLLSAERFGEKNVLPLYETRSRFEQDYDRIIFSHPFRKLQDKTQVFPMPEDDFVHTRLTHSLEVASVGRSLGKEVGKKIVEMYPGLQESGITYHDFGAITSAASLAHDVGNPPFGHSGEDSISSFFKDTPEGSSFKERVSASEWSDLTNFEGNAQGYRILNNLDYGGLKLTFATLAAFSKYPRSSDAEIIAGRKSQKKYGFSQSEETHFSQMAETMGLRSLGQNNWCRHPLTFLVEAADDICYSVIDLEDGCRLGLVSFDQARDLLASIIGDRYSPDKLDKMQDMNEKLGALRALAIHRLIQETVEAFVLREKQILAGDFDQALTDNIASAPTLSEISQLSVKKIYRSKQVIEREASGYVIVSRLMKDFSEAVHNLHFDQENRSAKNTTTYRLLPDHIQQKLKGQNLSIYKSLQVVIDFVSSLTDSSAARLFRILTGSASVG